MSVQKIDIDHLTDFEKSTLSSNEKTITGPEGFVDIDSPVKDASTAQEKRKQAVQMLESVTKNTSDSAQNSTQKLSENAAENEKTFEQLQKELEMTRSELDEVRKQLKTRDPCPRCGLKLHETVTVEPTPLDIEEFLQAVIAGEVFKKTYYAFGNKLSFTFRSKTYLEEESIKSAIIYASKNKIVNTDYEVVHLLRNIMLAVCLEECKSASKSYISTVYFNYQNSEEFLKQVQQKLNSLPLQIHKILIKYLMEFNELVDILSARSTDENFWQRTSGSLR